MRPILPVMEELSAIKYEVRKSKFYAHLYSAGSKADVATIRRIHGDLYRKAAHHCYAARIVTDEVEDSFFGSDGEVGSPGRVLMKVLEANGLNTHCIIVSRVFGGVKLGPAGVSQAFRRAGSAAVGEYINMKDSGG